MVTFTDGSTLAQASPPDMKLPIALALGWPSRVPQAALPATSPPRRRGSSSRFDAEVFPRGSWRARQAGRVAA